MKNGVGRRRSFPVRDHSAVAAALDHAVPRRPTVEQGVHDPGSASVREKTRAKTDQAARGNGKFQPDATRAGMDHLRHFALAHR